MENLEEFKILAKKHNTEIVLSNNDHSECDWLFYEDEGACGYPLFISRPKNKDIDPSSNIYTSLQSSVSGLVDAIMDQNVNKLWFNCDDVLEECSYELFEELNG